MAPEQVRGEGIDGRCDVYSLGGVACFLLTGRPPYERDTLEELCAAHVSAPPPSLRERVGTIPQELEAIVLRCLAKSADDRPARVQDVAAALRALPQCADWDAERAANLWRDYGVPALPAFGPAGSGAAAAGRDGTTDALARTEVGAPSVRDGADGVRQG